MENLNLRSFRVEIKVKKGVTFLKPMSHQGSETTLEALAGLRPAFQKDGKVTAGNAPGLNDGSAAVVISSRAYADQVGVKPLAKIIGYAQAALEPKYLFAAPAKAIPVLLQKIGWTLQDVDLIELK